MSTGLLETRPTTWRMLLLALGASVASSLLWNVALSLPAVRGWQLGTEAELALFTIINWIDLFVIVGVIIFRLGRLRPSDVGWNFPAVGRAILVTIGFWIAMQLGLALFQWSKGRPLVWNDAWQTLGPGYLLGTLCSQLVGNALIEETFFRGFLLPQFHEKARGFGRPAVAWTVALLASQLIFTLSHLPSQVFLRDLPADRILEAQLENLILGLALSAVYLVTRNLFVAVGLHALYNQPARLLPVPFAPGVKLVWFSLVAILLIAWAFVRKMRTGRDGRATNSVAAATGLLIPIMIAGEATAQSPPNRIEAKRLQTDLDFLVTTLRDVHPATLNGLPLELEQAVAQARAELHEPMTSAEAWPVLSRVLVTLRDGHTVLHPPASDAMLELPIVWLAEDGIIVRKDTDELRRGDRVLAINGRNEEQLLTALEQVVSSENSHWLRAHGEEKLPDLSVLRALRIADEAPVSVRIEREGQEMEVLVGAAKPKKSQPVPWVRHLIDKPNDLAVLTLDNCRFTDEYKSAVREFFTAVHQQGIGRVAIDLRANEGGNSQVIDEFFRFLKLDGFRGFGSELRWSDAAIAQRGRSGSGVQKFQSRWNRNRYYWSPPPFAGELFLITGKQTFSSANWFAVISQDNRFGQVIGEPTGNGPSRFGDVLGFKLPHTELDFGVSHKLWIRPNPTRDPADSLVPDVLIQRTRRDVRDGIDPVIEFLKRERSLPAARLPPTARWPILVYGPGTLGEWTSVVLGPGVVVILAMWFRRRVKRRRGDFKTRS